MRSHIDITHSILGAEVARRHFFVDDEEILQAISRHTMGNKNMSLLDKVILLADYIEPERPSCPVVDQQRKEAYVNINQSIITGTNFTNEDLRKRNRPIHPWCLEMLATLEEELS
jgi:nicotinate-nucleotide adenylyltransferase